MPYSLRGVMVPPIDQLTADGYDLQFGTNVVGHFLFTYELLSLLESGAQSSPDKKARVVNTSSSAAMLMPGKLNFEGFKDTPTRKKLGQQRLYAQSKFVGYLIFWALKRANPSVFIIS